MRPRVRPIEPADLPAVVAMVHELAAYERAPEECGLTEEQLGAAVFGDELRYLDWKVAARSDRLVVKRFEEETNLRATIALDVSRSMRWRGSDARLEKGEYAARLTAAVALLFIRQRDAVLWGGRLQPGEVVHVPDAPNVHLFIARGAAALEGAGPLSEGDAARLVGAGDPTLTAGDDGAEVLIWATA